MIQQNSGAPSPLILVVEDEALVRMSTVACLQDFGCHTLGARSSDEAIQILQDTPEIRVLFTDIQMPGTLDGLALARLVRRKWPSISVVICSGHVLPPKEALPDGVRFIAKPYFHGDLEHIANAAKA